MAWSLVLDEKLSDTRHSLTGAVSLTVAGWAQNDFSWQDLDFLGEKGGPLVWY